MEVITVTPIEFAPITTVEVAVAEEASVAAAEVTWANLAMEEGMLIVQAEEMFALALTCIVVGLTAIGVLAALTWPELLTVPQTELDRRKIIEKKRKRTALCITKILGILGRARTQAKTYEAKRALETKPEPRKTAKFRSRA